MQIQKQLSHIPLPLTMSLELSPRQPKPQSTNIARDAIQVWKMMTPESKKGSYQPLAGGTHVVIRGGRYEA